MAKPPPLTEPTDGAKNSTGEETKELLKMVLWTQDPPPVKLSEMEKLIRVRLQYNGCSLLIFLDYWQPRHLLQNFEFTKSPGGGSQCSLHEEMLEGTDASTRHVVPNTTWEAFKWSTTRFSGQLTGIIAAFYASVDCDKVLILTPLAVPAQNPGLGGGPQWSCHKYPALVGQTIENDGGLMKFQEAALIFDEVFMRDFIPIAMMKNLLTLGQIVMAASFNLPQHNLTQEIEKMVAHFSGSTIWRVGPVKGDSSLADNYNCQAAVPLLLRMLLLEGCDNISSAFVYVNGCSMIDQTMVSMRDSIHSALSFLLEEPLKVKNFLVEKMFDIIKNGRHLMPGSFKMLHHNSTQITKKLLSDFCGAAIERLAHVDSGLWCIIQFRAYTRWAGDNSLSKYLNRPGAMHLILRFSSSKDRALLSASARSMINKIVMHAMFPKGSRPTNCIIVCFDGSNDEFLQNYRRGIEGIRLWCYANGKRVLLPRIYGPNLEVFTTPADGTLYLILEYKGRYIPLSIAGRNLYFMGWRSDHGTFGLNPDCQKEQYMTGTCVTLDIDKNYRFLAPNGNVGETRIGPLALKQTFEILYKCHGKVFDGLRQAIAMIAVNFCEASRIQSILNDVCSSFHDYNVDTLDSKNPNNSYWVRNWDDLAGTGMERADLVDNGQILVPLNFPDAPIKVTSELEIFSQIRILPRNAYNTGIFESDDDKGETDDDKKRKRKLPVFEGPLDDGSGGMESGNKRLRSDEKQRGKKKASHLKEPSKGGDGEYPSYSLLDDWGGGETIINQEKEQSDVVNVEEEQKDNIEQESSDAKLSGPTDVSFGDYLDHFSMVKKLVNLNNNRTETLELPVMTSFDRPSHYGAKETVPLYGIMRPKIKELTFSGGLLRPDFVPCLRRPQLPHLQRNVLRACSLMAKFIRLL